MGFFSWNCKGCEHPLLSEYVTNPVNHWMNEAVAIPKDHDPDTQEVRKGHYDGYGTLDEKVGDNTNTYQLELDDPCVWHRACWEAAGNPTDYEPSKSSDDQGYFFDEGDHDMPEPKHERTFRNPFYKRPTEEHNA